MAWTSWINLGVWMYWTSAISAGQLVKLVMSFGLKHYLLVLGASSFSFLLPPLVSIAAVVTILSSPTHFKYLALKRRMLGEAVAMVPLGVFLAGMGVTSAGLGFALTGVVIAYVTYRLLMWFHWSHNFSAVVPVESGELFERTLCLANRAGVRLTRLSLLRNAHEEEANAFASAGGAIVLTQTLIDTLPVREIDFVVAHELGHHKAGHLRFDLSRALLSAYMAAQPALAWIVERLHAPHWLLTLPIAPLLFMFLQNYVSKRRELEADLLGVELTGDPEGAIAALTRTARLSDVPSTTSGISNAILSHPSIESRAIALARRFHVHTNRALAILRNPDEAYRDMANNHLSPTTFAVESRPVFPLRARVLLLEQLYWLRLLTLLGGSILLASALATISHLLAVPLTVIKLLFGSMPVLALTLVIEDLWYKRTTSRIRALLAERLKPAENSVFVGLHPGRGVRYTEGFPDWDFGFLTLEGNWLCYRGEKLRFAVARREIQGIRVSAGPVNWLRERRIELTWASGALTFSQGLGRSSKFRTCKLAHSLQAWVSAESLYSAHVESPESLPLMPHLPGAETTRIRGALRAFDTTLKILIGATLLFMLAWQRVPAGVILLASLTGIVRMLPQAIWPSRRHC